VDTIFNYFCGERQSMASPQGLRIARHDASVTNKIIIGMYLLRKEGRKRAREQDFENIRPTISRSKTILDLDDACLIHLFNLLNPLPDLFNAARSCKVTKMTMHLSIYNFKNNAPIKTFKTLI